MEFPSFDTIADLGALALVSRWPDGDQWMFCTRLLNTWNKRWSLEVTLYLPGDCSRAARELSDANL